MNLRQNLRIISSATSRISKENKRVVIDFSSPNIAKPFHFGHLKSTILGNFLANLYRHYGNEVIKLNYIGDWGVQYGLLSLGLEDESTGQLKQGVSLDTIRLNHLLEIYVTSNERARADPEFYEKAKGRFRLLDIDRDKEQLTRWRQIRDISLAELTQSYEQLAIQYDAFEYESDYITQSHELIQRMRSLGLVSTLDTGVSIVKVTKNERPLEVPLLKSDGSSLYITRDVAAALKRKEKYNFDEMLYVVGSDQEKHFHSLREIIRQIDGCQSWADKLTHVKMGKVVGMSSRSGQALLLSDILEEATHNYIESTKSVPTSKVSQEADIEEVGRQLALSALFVYDMRNRRTRNYEFDWKHVMVAGERSGIHLQTSYARLCSLARKAKQERDLKPYETVDEINYDSVCCIEGVHLINVMNDLDRRMAEAYANLDPSPLVSHALLLCKAANSARRSDWLHVLKEPDDSKAMSRLTLFNCARSQLEFIIRILGLKPLERV